MTPARARADLAAYDYLSCWCRPDQHCHVDEYIRAIIYTHRLTDTCKRYCLICRACLHRNSAIEEPLAGCQDCGETLVGWWNPVNGFRHGA